MEGIQGTKMNLTAGTTASLIATMPEHQASSRIGAGDSITTAVRKQMRNQAQVIRYDSKFLQRLRFSPASTQAPDNLPAIPDVTFPPRPPGRQSPPPPPPHQTQMYPPTHMYTSMPPLHMRMMPPPPPPPPFYQEYPYKRVILKNVHNGIMTVYDTEHPNGSENYSYM